NRRSGTGRRNHSVRDHHRHLVTRKPSLLQRMKKLFLSILILLTHCLPAQNTLLWEISGGGLERKSYLYGTMHLLCKHQVQFSDSVLAALDSCEHLIFEMDDSKVGLLKQLKVVRMQGDTTLEQLLSEA